MLTVGRSFPSCKQTMRGVFFILSLAVAIRCYFAFTRCVDGIIDLGRDLTQWTVEQIANVAEPLCSWMWWLAGCNIWTLLLRPSLGDEASFLSVPSTSPTPPFHSTSPSPPPSFPFATPSPTAADAVSAALELATPAPHVALEAIYSVLSNVPFDNASLATATSSLTAPMAVQHAFKNLGLWVLSPAGVTAVLTCLFRRA